MAAVREHAAHVRFEAATEDELDRRQSELDAAKANGTARVFTPGKASGGDATNAPIGVVMGLCL
jgi:hypothetical protein